jgi:hypothetical protein
MAARRRLSMTAVAPAAFASWRFLDGSITGRRRALNYMRAKKTGRKSGRSFMSGYFLVAGLL